MCVCVCVCVCGLHQLPEASAPAPCTLLAASLLRLGDRPVSSPCWAPAAGGSRWGGGGRSGSFSASPPGWAGPCRRPSRPRPSEVPAAGAPQMGGTPSTCPTCPGSGTSLVFLGSLSIWSHKGSWFWSSRASFCPCEELEVALCSIRRSQTSLDPCQSFTDARWGCFHPHGGHPQSSGHLQPWVTKAQGTARRSPPAVGQQLPSLMGKCGLILDSKK